MKKIISLLLCFCMVIGAGITVFAADAKGSQVIRPSGIFAKADGTILICDQYGKAIWSQNGGVMTRMTGKTQILGVDGVPVGGYIDGTLKQAVFMSPWAIAPYGGGYAITDTDNNMIRFMDTAKVSTAAGGKKSGLVNKNGTSARFDRPTGLAADGKGNLYIADTGNSLIRFMDSAGNVSTYAGSVKGNADGQLLSARFNEPTGLFFADGVLYVADSGNHRICKIENGVVSTLAGVKYQDQSDGFFEGGYADGNAKTAEFSAPQGIAAANGAVYVADTGNSAIRKIQNGVVSTLLVRSNANDLYPVSPRAIAVSGNKLLISDVFAGKVFSLDTGAKAANNQPAGNNSAASPKQGGEVYTVREGDTLMKISRDFGCSLDELISLNGFADPDLIFAGQQIKIPKKQ